MSGCNCGLGCCPPPRCVQPAAPLSPLETFLMGLVVAALAYVLPFYLILILSPRRSALTPLSQNFAPYQLPPRKRRETSSQQLT